MPPPEHPRAELDDEALRAIAEVSLAAVRGEALPTDARADDRSRRRVVAVIKAIADAGASER